MVLIMVVKQCGYLTPSELTCMPLKETNIPNKNISLKKSKQGGRPVVS